MNLTQKETIEYLKTEVKKYQSRQRFEHTLSVLSECEKLAGIFGLGDAERFDLCKAAVLHDLTKDMNGAKQASLCEKYGLPVPENVSAPMPTIHQDTGAYFARETFGNEIVDDAVFSAVASHTTGKAGMNITDKLLFVADYIEESRKYASCIQTREYLYAECGKINKNDKAALARLLDKTVADVIGYTADFLITKRRNIDCRTILAWNDLI